MVLSLKTTLISGAVIALISGPFGMAMGMILGDSPQKMSALRGVVANLVFWLFILDFPIYIVILAAALILANKREQLAYRLSLVPLLLPSASVMLFLICLIM
jgi:hypothetical protein